MAYRSQAPRMQRPPRAPRAASASSRPDDGWHFHEPRGHVHTTSVPSERPQSKRIPTNGIVMRHGVNAGKIALTNHRMKPSAADNERGNHSTPPCSGKNNTIYAETYRRDRSLNASPNSMVPGDSYCKGGKVKRTGSAKLHKNELVLPVSLVKQLEKLMKH